MSSDQASARSLWAAVAANVGVAFAKLAAALVTGSVSMLAEAAHSVADTAKQGLMFYGRARASRNADPHHPFGYGHERYFWGFLVAVVLFPAGAVYAGVESIRRWTEPSDISEPWWAMAVLAVAMVLDGGSFIVAIRSARAAGHRESWWGLVRRARNPDFPVVLLEDSSAVVGVLLAAAGIGLSVYTGDSRWDAAAGSCIAVLLLATGAALAIEMKSLIVGESALPALQRRLVDLVRREPKLEHLIYLRTLHLGPENLVVLAKVELRKDLDFEEVVETIDRIERRVYEHEPSVALFHIEPDIYDATRGRPEWVGYHPEDDATVKDE